ENKEREEKDNFRLHDWNKELKATARHTNLKEVGKAISNTGLTSFGNDSLVKMTILYAMGEKGKSLGEVIQSSDREIEEIGKQFIKEIQSKPAGGSAALEITPEQETENAKWYGNMYKKAQMKLFEEDIVFPKPNDGGSVDSLNKIRGSHFFGIAEMTDYNTNTPLSNKTSSYSKNPHKLKLATLFNEGMGEFTPEESAKRRILDSYYTLIEGATNPAQNYQERAAAKLIAECELFPVLGGVKLNEIDKEELVNFHQYLIDAKLVWNNGIIDLYDYQKAFNNLKPEECRLILDNSVDTLRKNHPDVFKKAFDGLMSMHPKAKGIQAAMENKPVERIKFVLAPEIKVEEKEEIKVENKAEIKIEEKPEIKVEEEPEIKVEEEPEINIIHDEKEDIPVRVSKNTKVEEFRTAAYKRGFKEAEDGAFLKSVLLAYKNVLEDKNISGLKKDELRDELNHLLSPNLNSDEKRNKAVDGLRKLLETDAFKNNAQCNKALSRIVERQNKVMGQDLQGPAKNVINVKPQAVKPEEKPVAPVKFDVPEEFPTKKEDLLKAFRQNGWNEKHDAAMLESMADLYFAASQRVQGKTEERINPDYIFLIEGMRTCFNKMVKQKADVRTRLELGEELQVTVTGIKVLHEFSKKAREEMEKWTNAEEKIRDAYEEKKFGDSKKEFLELADLNGWGKTNAEKQMLRNLYDCYNEADIVPEDDKQAKVCQTLTDQLRPVLNRMATKAAGDDKQKTEILASAGKACENALKDSNLFELNNLLERSVQSIYVSKKAIDAGTEKPVLKARNIENEMKKPEWKAPEPKTEIRFPQKPGDFVSKAVANGWEDEKQERRFLKNIRALYGIIESDITENKKVTNENLSNREKMIDFLNRITAAKNPDTRAREAFMDEAVELTKDMDAANVRVCVSQMKDAVKLRKTAYADERKKEEAARLERERVKAAEELRRREEENRKREEENRKREEALKVREEELKKRSERLQNKGNVLPIKTAKELFEIYTNPENQKVLDKCISISDYFGFYEGDHQELVNSWGEYFEKFSFIKERKPSDMERLRTFRDFLYTRLEDNKTFYEHIMIYCVENGYEEPVKDGIEYFNNLFGLGIDMEALENGTAPLPEKDALEEMKREEEENREQEKRVKKILEER
ncbi:MAG: hypothetical protein IKO32_07510, partial [Lachnospiraceae bacterium]|nr:hypothetical protein [Lachnospiraceae bacterium]